MPGRRPQPPEIIAQASVLWLKGDLTIGQIAKDLGVTVGIIKGWSEKDRAAFPKKEANALRSRAKQERLRLAGKTVKVAQAKPVESPAPRPQKTEIQFAGWVIRKKEWPVKRLDQNGVPSGYVTVSLAGGMVPA